MSLVGVSKSAKINASINNLQDLKVFLINLKSQLYFSRFSLEEIILESNDEFSQKIKNTKNWQNKNHCVLIKNQMSMQRDKENVENFFANFGKTDIDQQMLNIDYELAYINERIREEKTEFKEKSRVNMVFYLFLGVAIVLVVI